MAGFTLTPVLLHEAGAGPGARFSTLSVPGSKTTLNESSFRNIPNCVTLKVRWSERERCMLPCQDQGQLCMGFSGLAWRLPGRSGRLRKQGCRA